MSESASIYVKFLRGTPSAFENLAQKKSDTLYFVLNEGDATGKLYLGETLISGGVNEEGLVTYLNDLQDVDTTGVANNMLLGYHEATASWIPMDPATVITISNMTGASSILDGKSGLVPAPKAGENKNFLRGDGVWSALTIEDITSLSSTLATLVSLETFNTELSKKANTSDLTSAINDLNLALANKPDKDSVYTKTETDTAIAAAITKASHLQRKIVDRVEDIYDYASNNDDADQYIFMVSSGLTLDDNKYYEYLVVYDADGSFIVEKVGDWEVSLENYVTNQELEDALKNKVDKVYFTVPVVDENGDPVYEEDGITQKTEQVEGTLLSPTDQNKLDSLVITEDGVEISGTVNAANVQGLNEWITQNRDIVPGLYPTQVASDVEKALSDLEELVTVVNTNTTDISTLNTRVDTVVNNLNNYVSLVEYNKKIASLESDIGTLKDAVSWKTI